MAVDTTYDSLEQANHWLTKQLKLVEEQLREGEDVNMSLVEENRILKETMSEMKGVFEELNRELEMQTSMTQQVNKEKETLICTVKSLEHQIKQYQQEEYSAQSAADELRNEMEKAQDIIAQYMTDVNDKNNYIVHLEEKLKDVFMQLQNTQIDSDSRLLIKDQEIQELSRRVDDLISMTSDNYTKQHTPESIYYITSMDEGEVSNKYSDSRNSPQLELDEKNEIIRELELRLESVQIANQITQESKIDILEPDDCLTCTACLKNPVISVVSAESQTEQRIFSQQETQTELKNLAEQEMQTVIKNLAEQETQTVIKNSAEQETQTVIKNSADLETQTVIKNSADLETQAQEKNSAELETQTEQTAIKEIETQTEQTVFTEIETQTEQTAFTEIEAQTSHAILTENQIVEKEMQTLMADSEDFSCQVSINPEQSQINQLTDREPETHPTSCCSSKSIGLGLSSGTPCGANSFSEILYKKVCDETLDHLSSRINNLNASVQLISDQILTLCKAVKDDEMLEGHPKVRLRKQSPATDGSGDFHSDHLETDDDTSVKQMPLFTMTPGDRPHECTSIFGGKANQPRKHMTAASFIVYLILSIIAIVWMFCYCVTGKAGRHVLHKITGVSSIPPH